VIDYETFSKIHDCHFRQGLTIAQAARALGLDPRTVATWVARSRFEPRRSRPRGSVLDPFKPRITRLLDTHPYSAQQIFQRLREEGYRGGVTILRDYVRRIRPTKRPVYLKLHFAPGECAQVDWGAYGTVAVGNTRRRLSFFVMVLAFSRQMFVEFTVSQTMEHFLACHEHGFAALGGVPSKIMVDNLKSAVLQRLAGAAPVFNPRYLDFARHHGFAIEACNVARGNEKGRVESGVGNVKKNFFPAWARVDRFQHDPSSRTGLARHHRQRAHPRRNATATRRFACARASASGTAQPASLRPRTHFDQCRL
jgi:transposase